jgi:hypothetical protein
MQRLTYGLRQAQTAALEVKAIFKQAEEQATSLLGREDYFATRVASLRPVAAAFFPGWWIGGSAPLEDAYVIKKEDLEQYRGKANGTGKHKGQCAAIAQTHFGKHGKPIGKVREWRPGASLMDHPELEYGTVIATFDKAGENGRYPNKKHGNHVAIFLYYVKNKDGQITGVRVLDQWDGREAQERTLEFLSPEEAKKQRSPSSRDDAGLLVDKANDMYVVTNPSKTTEH